MVKKENHVKGKTSTGFAYDIDPGIFDNYELFELFAEVEENQLVIPKIIRAILGKEQKDALIEHVRGEDGIAKVEDISKELMEILESSKTAKN